MRACEWLCLCVTVLMCVYAHARARMCYMSVCVANMGWAAYQASLCLKCCLVDLPAPLPSPQSDQLPLLGNQQAALCMTRPTRMC